MQSSYLMVNGVRVILASASATALLVLNPFAASAWATLETHPDSTQHRLEQAKQPDLNSTLAANPTDKAIRHSTQRRRSRTAQRQRTQTAQRPVGQPADTAQAARSPRSNLPSTPLATPTPSAPEVLTGRPGASQFPKNWASLNPVLPVADVGAIAQAAPTRPADQPLIDAPVPANPAPTAPPSDPPSTENTTPETPTAPESAPANPAPEAAPTETSPAEATPTTPATGTPTTPSLPAGTGTPGTTLQNSQSERAPEYLNPSPNPLNFPTNPEEVRITGTQPITLEQALELARRNNRQLQEAQLQVDQVRAQVREARAALQPTLDATVNLTNTTAQQRTQSLLGAGDIEFRNNTGFNSALQLSYTLFSSGLRIANINAAEASARAQQLQVEVQAEQLRLDVSNDYYQMQQRDEEVRIAERALEQAQRSLRDAEAQERAGVGTRFDVLQAQVDVANAQQDLTQALSQRIIARRQLAQRVGLAEGVSVAAADAIAPSANWALTLEDSVVLAYRNRAELQQQLLQREVAQQRRRAALAQLRPQLSVFAQYQIVNSTLLDDGDFLQSVQAGARLQWSLLDGGAARARARQREIDRELAENRFAEQRELIRFQVEQAYLSLQANSANIPITRLGVERASESLRLARLRFQAGVGTQSDVLRAQTELTNAEVRALRAVLDYNRSLVALQRAVSNLPDGNLAESP